MFMQRADTCLSSLSSASTTRMSARAIRRSSFSFISDPLPCGIGGLLAGQGLLTAIDGGEVVNERLDSLDRGIASVASRQLARQRLRDPGSVGDWLPTVRPDRAQTLNKWGKD